MGSQETNPAYPNRPITLIVGFPPGGSLDLTAQPLVQALAGYLPQPVQVVHQPGESGTLGMAEMVKAEPDGYTLNMAAMGLLTIQPHIRHLPFNTTDDYTPIISLVNNPVGFAVRADAPWRTVAEFVHDARANPGKIRVADLGMGSALHLATEQLMVATQSKLTPLHMTGSPACVEALRSGEVEAVTNHHAVFAEDVKAGTFRVLGVFEGQRNPLFPEAETFREAGFDIIFDSYACLVGPKGLSAEVISVLHEACKKAMDDALFVDPMKEKGLDLYYQGPDDLKKILDRDLAANAAVVKEMGLTAG